MQTPTFFLDGKRIEVKADTWLLSHLQPLFGRIGAWAASHRPVTVHTGLYEREDFLALIEQQRGQEDSRFSNDELSLLTHALTYSEKIVSDVMVPRKVVRSVRAEEVVGPIMMGELHDSGHPYKSITNNEYLCNKRQERWYDLR